MFLQYINNYFKNIKKITLKYKKILIVLMVVLLSIIPLISNDNYFKGMLVRIMLYGILASALNVINGYSGMFCLGIAGMMCIGAYVEAILSTRYNISFWVILPIAGFISALFGLIVSIPAIRLKGIYFSIVTMGFSEIVRLTALNWESVTGGAMGIKLIPQPRLFGVPIKSVNNYYYLIFIILIICLVSIDRIIKSKIGRAWLSIREDELAARSLGVNLIKYKALNFFVGAFWAGVSGAISAPYYRYISSDMFTTTESFNVLSMIIIGGQGTLIGPLIGSIVSNGLSELLRFADEYRLIVYSIIIIITMWVRPQGIAGSDSATLTGKRKKRSIGNKKKATEVKHV